MKKVIILALTSSLLLAGCGDKEANNHENQTNEQLLARVGQLEEENKQLKAQLEQNDIAPSLNQEQDQENTKDTAQEEQTSSPEKAAKDTNTNTSSEQIIQNQPGNTQSDNYFELTGKGGIYKQTGDAFLLDDQNGNGQVVVIPIQFTNLKDDANDPWISFVFDFTTIQEDDVQEYTLDGGQGGLPEEYENPLNMNVKKDATVDYYLAFRPEKEGHDLKINDQWTNENKCILKFQ